VVVSFCPATRASLRLVTIITAVTKHDRYGVSFLLPPGLPVHDVRCVTNFDDDWRPRPLVCHLRRKKLRLARPSFAKKPKEVPLAATPLPLLQE